MLCNCHPWKISITCQDSFFKLAIKIKSTYPPESVSPASFTIYGLGRQRTSVGGVGAPSA